MNSSDDLALIVMYTGPRGSGKTLVQTGDMARRLIIAYYKRLLGIEYEQIYSNYPVGFMFYPGHGLPSAYLQPKPLNMESLYVFDEGLRKCRLYIDEIDQWLDRQEWMTTTQQILAKAVQLIRKRKMSISGTIQNFHWLNSKFQFQTDIVVKCRDAAFTPWGRERRLALGEVIFISSMDKSGIITGYSYEERQRLYPMTLQTKRLWNTYDTTYEFDPLESSTRYTLKRPQKEIVLRGAEPTEGNNDGGSPVALIRDKNSYLFNRRVIDDIVTKAVADYTAKNIYKINKKTFFAYVDHLRGQPVDHKEVGHAMSRLGYRSYGTGLSKYNLEPIIGIMDGTLTEEDKVELYDPGKQLVGSRG